MYKRNTETGEGRKKRATEEKKNSNSVRQGKEKHRGDFDLRRGGGEEEGGYESKIFGES